MNNQWPAPKRTNITITDNKFLFCGGVDLYNVTDFEISNNIMVRESHKIPYYVGDSRYHDKVYGGNIAYLSNCEDGLIQNNQGYTPKSLGTITIAGGSNIIVSGNSIVTNPSSPLAGDNGFAVAGINVWYKATDIVVNENTVKGIRKDSEDKNSYGAGILIDDSSCQVTGNILEDNDYGVLIKKAGEIQISGNTFAENAVHAQDDRTEPPANYLEEVLDSNTFPVGAQIDGNKIIVPNWADYTDTSW
jgi:parallel beta-helix repeat protein